MIIADCRNKKGGDDLRPQIVDKVRFVHAGCGVNALSGLQNHANSMHCRSLVGLISVAHQAINLTHVQTCL
ncbi:hypothetical protein FRV13_17775 [Escherichia coli]|nr:hypothetical protein [Escherichia coli]QEG87972.1 hypothetical protein FRV13_17775 [Escherichia coli]